MSATASVRAGMRSNEVKAFFILVKPLEPCRPANRPCGSRQDLARDRQDLDLRGSAAELDQLRVARQPLDDVLLHVAVAGEDVDRLERDEGSGLGAVQLAGADVGDGLVQL